MDLLGHFAACGVCDLARSWCWGGEHAIWHLLSFQNDPRESTMDHNGMEEGSAPLTLMPAALRVPALCPGSLSLGSESATGVLSLCTLPTHVPLAAPCRAAGADSLWVSCMAPMVHRAAAGPQGV